MRTCVRARVRTRMHARARVNADTIKGVRASTLPGMLCSLNRLEFRRLRLIGSTQLVAVAAKPMRSLLLPAYAHTHTHTPSAHCKLAFDGKLGEPEGTTLTLPQSRRDKKGA